jgi:hypothetical protein
LDKAYFEALAGASHEALVALLTEEAQQAMKFYLDHDKVHLDPAPSTFMSEHAWEAMVPCKVCGQGIGYHEPHASVIPAHSFAGYLCHLGCVPKDTVPLGSFPIQGAY